MIAIFDIYILYLNYFIHNLFEPVLQFSLNLMFYFKMVPKEWANILLPLTLIFNVISKFVHYFITWTELSLYSFDPIYDAPKYIDSSNYRRELPAYRRERFVNAEAKIHKYMSIHVWLVVIILGDMVRIWSKYNFDFAHERMPELLTHKMYPEAYWNQGDMIILCANLGVLFTGLSCSLREWLDDKYCMYFVQSPDKRGRILIVNGKGIVSHSEA